MKKIFVIILTKYRIRSSRKRVKKFNRQISLTEIKTRYADRTIQYKYFHHFFWNIAPLWLKNHRDYFTKYKRGFGEDAFHAMWYFLFKEFKPQNILEIGVYRGQTVSLFSLLSKELCFKCEIHGISPFTSAGDEVSEYLENLDYYEDVLTNFNYFGLPLPSLHRGFSTDVEMIKVIQSRKWDMIYIDGNHDYDVVKHDFNICSEQLKHGGIIVLDDSALYTNYKPQINSTAGHPGPSRLVNEIDMNLFEEVLSVGHNRVFRKRK